jgi:HlyD family secretion protein
MDIRKRRLVIMSAIAVFVVLALIYGFRPRPVLSEVAPAMRGTLRVTVEEQGKTRVKDRYAVSAPVSGYLRRITLKAADPVEKGMQVAAIEPARSQALDPRTRAEAEAAVETARANLRTAQEQEQAARSDADYAAQRLARFMALHQKSSIAKDSLDQAESDAKRTRATLRSTAAQVDAARAELARSERVLGSYDSPGAGAVRDIMAVSSPVDGKVLRILRESEGTVMAGERLMEVGNPENLEVEVEVLSSDGVKLSRGTPVTFERWGGGSTLAGVVSVVEPGGFTKISSLGVEEQRVIVLADITTPRAAWKGLGDAYRLDVSFIVWEGRDVLQVPASAVFRSGKGGWAVFVAENSRARLRVVETGHSSGLATEIVSGLKAGEKVIAHPDETIRDGARIKANE